MAEFLIAASRSVAIADVRKGVPCSPADSTAAEAAVRRLRGVKGISNLITLKPRVPATEVKAKIEDALKRMAEVDADRITVSANGSEVVLSGTVRSWAERQEAERAAWRAPGVKSVRNLINIDWT